MRNQYARLAGGDFGSDMSPYSRGETVLTDISGMGRYISPDFAGMGDIFSDLATSVESTVSKEVSALPGQIVAGAAQTPGVQAVAASQVAATPLLTVGGLSAFFTTYKNYILIGGGLLAGYIILKKVMK